MGVAHKLREMSFRRGLLPLFVANLVVAIIPFGSIPESALPLTAVFSALVTLTILLINGVPRNALWLFGGASLSCIVAILWIYLQLGWPAAILRANPAWLALPPDIVAGPGVASIQPAMSQYSTLQMTLPILVFLSGLCVCQSDELGRACLKALGYLGASIALYAVVQFVVSPETSLFLQKKEHLDSLTATFLNRNSAGTFLGLVLLVLLRSCWSEARRVRHAFPPEMGSERRRREGTASVRLLSLAMATLLVAIALLLTKSRGAIGSTTFSAALMIILLIYFPSVGSSPSPGSMKRLGLIAISAITLTVVLLVFGGRVLLRSEVEGSGDARFCTLPRIWEMVKSVRETGYGFGNFREAFAAYRDPACGLNFYWGRAHNFYLEGIGGLGPLFIALLFISLGALTWAQCIGLVRRRRLRSYSCLGLACLILVCAHSAVDYSLQIPGVAAYLAAVLAVTSSLSLLKPGPIRLNAHET